MEIPQVQFLGWFFTSVVVQRQAKTVEVLQLQYFQGGRVLVVQVVDGSLAGGASNSVHRQSLWAFSVHRDMGLSAGFGDEGRSSSHR